MTEDERRRRLRAAKARATGLLLVAAAVFLTCRLVPGGDRGVLGFVQAAADAGMVGDLADWFAVTALFRHPLGVPVPHTALVPRKKDELATQLGTFVTEHFLGSDQIAEQVRSRALVRSLGEWLAVPVNADRLAGEVAALLAAGLDALDAESMSDYVLELVRRDAQRRSYAPMAGRLLRRALDGGMQRPLVDVIVSRAHAYLGEHRDEARDLLREYASGGRWYVRAVGNSDRVLDHLVDRAIETLAEVERDPEHELRGQLDGLLASYADSLETSYELAAKLNSAVLAQLKDPRVQRVFAELVADGMTSVRESLAGEHTDVRSRLARLIQELGSRAVTDREFHDRVETRLVSVLDLAVTRYGDELTTLIRTQVAKWDSREIADKIELAVGRDLQFIRINGTVVGALAGLVIHAVATLL